MKGTIQLMRMRKKKCTPKRLEMYKDFFIHPKEGEIIDCEAVFGNKNPVKIEIGAGKGNFITQLAKLNPDINYIAFEKCDDVIAIAATKSEGIPNLRYANTDATLIDTVFKEKSIAGLYLNFSDPWKKSGQKKRRLTHNGFLKKYEKILMDGATIEFKTDNVLLWEFSLEEIGNYPMEITEIYNDLHKEKPEGNIMTEYEERFSSQGVPIHKLVANFKTEE